MWQAFVHWTVKDGEWADLLALQSRWLEGLTLVMAKDETSVTTLYKNRSALIDIKRNLKRYVGFAPRPALAA